MLLSFNRFTIWLGLGVLPIVALYPFVKRISHWPQAVLGLAFNWGALMGWAAVLGRLDLAPLVLYAGAVCWTIGYDTIYAHQDREDDGLLGVKSTALRFGRRHQAMAHRFFTRSPGSQSPLPGFWQAPDLRSCSAWRAAALQLAWQVATLDIDDPENCLHPLPLEPRLRAIVLAAILIDMGLASRF